MAPGAKLIPFRVGETVIIFDTLNLARSIEKAADAGAHVVSISMGGLFSDRLHDAIVYAQGKGVIVLAAAGNCVQFVIWPAAYDEWQKADVRPTPRDGGSDFIQLMTGW